MIALKALLGGNAWLIASIVGLLVTWFTVDTSRLSRAKQEGARQAAEVQRQKAEKVNDNARKAHDAARRVPDPSRVLLDKYCRDC
jgi:peptide subunit release factor 1 (eRF1)